MPADPNAPMLPFVSEYTPWTTKVKNVVLEIAARAEAGFAVRNGALTSTQPREAVLVTPEHPQGALANEKA